MSVQDQLREAEALLEAVLRLAAPRVDHSPLVEVARRRTEQIASLRERFPDRYPMGCFQYRDEHWLEKEHASPGHEDMKELLSILKELS